MKRVVITGMGVVSPIGNSIEEVKQSLWEGRSGISHNEEYQEFGFRSNVCGAINVDTDSIERKPKRFMGQGSMWNYLAMQQAIAHSQLTDEQVKRTGCNCSTLIKTR